MSKANQSANSSLPPMMKLTSILSILSFLGLIGLLIFTVSSKKKLAFVKSDVLMSQYQGMVEARAAYKVKADSWQSRIDTLRTDLDKGVKAYEAGLSGMNTKQREVAEGKLRKQNEDLMRYTDAISKQAEEEDQKMTQSVLNQVNSLLEVYGKENNYDIIFGANGNGNIIYGVDAVDITNEVLIELNRNYEGS